MAEAFERFFEGGSPGVYNLGGGSAHAISLLECIDLIDRTTGRKSEVRFEKARFGDLKYFVCDSGKARRDFGFAPAVRPEEGVPRLIEWVRQNFELFSPGEAA